MPDSLPLHVLIAEPDGVARLAVRAAIERLEHLCSAAEAHPEAVEILERDRPSVVLTAWDLPGADAGALARRVRELSSDAYAYLVVLSPPGDEAAVRTAREAGADEVLAAPFDAGQVEGLLISARRVLALQAELRAEARIDPVTRLPNRRAMAEELRVMHLRATRYGTDLAAVLFDIDRFTAYNDAGGRPAGEALLRRVADTLSDSLRGSDSLYRYGGEEFLALLPDQDSGSAAVAAERLRATVEVQAFSHPAGGLVTISAGVAALHDGESFELFTTRLDRALREAKEAGRNSVRTAESWPHVQSRAQ
jgi:diguanylate cyclase (GGDEF)-like protein